MISVGRVHLLSPEGDALDREVVHHPGAVSVVAVTDDDELVLVRQYRAAVDRELWEIPAGKRDKPGEDPADVARRELQEEAGLAASEMELLMEFHNSPGFCDEHSWVFLATSLTEVPHDRQGPEEQHLEVHVVPFDQALLLIDRGEITDAKTVIGLFALDRRRRSLGAGP